LIIIASLFALLHRAPIGIERHFGRIHVNVARVNGEERTGMKTRNLVFGVMVCMTAMSTVAKAQVMLDVTKITCGQFAAYKITNPKYIAVWVSGYYHGTHGEMVIDTQRLAANADKLVNYCLKNPDVALLKAVETALGKQ
jgi:acid stress chaperone HdeB